MASLRIHRGRSITRVVVCIAIGFVVNLLIAWACALWIPHLTPEIDGKVLCKQECSWPGAVPRAWVERPNLVKESRVLGRTACYAYGYAEYAPPASPIVMHCYHTISGWPFACFCSTEFLEITGHFTADYATPPGLKGWLIRGIPIRSSPDDWFRLMTPSGQFLVKTECLPVWPVGWPLAANVSVYSAAAYLSWVFFTTVRAASRRRRGLCHCCAYDTRGLTRCPECGTELTAPSSPSAPPRS